MLHFFKVFLAVLHLFDPLAAHLFSMFSNLLDRVQIGSRSYSPRENRGKRSVAARTGLEPVLLPSMFKVVRYCPQIDSST